MASKSGLSYHDTEEARSETETESIRYNCADPSLGWEKRPRQNLPTATDAFEFFSLLFFRFVAYPAGPVSVARADWLGGRRVEGRTSGAEANDSRKRTSDTMCMDATVPLAL